MEYLLVFLITTLLFVPIRYKYSTKIHKLFYLFYCILPCYVISILFIGLRKDVGIDYDLYYNMFYFGWGENKEFGFRMLNDLFRQLNLPLSSVLIFMATLSLFFAFYLINKESKTKVLSFILLWLDGGIIYLLNVMRQGLTNFIFLNIIGMLRDKKKIVYIFLILLGCLFHYSILIAVLFLPLLIKRYTKKKLIILYLSGIILMLFINIPAVVIYLLELIPYFGELYLQDNLVESLVLRRDFGLGYLFNFLLVLSAILFYDKILIDNSKILPYLNAFIIWGILKILTLDVWVFERILDYLRYSSIIVIPSMLMAINNKYLRFLVGVLIYLVYFILYIKSTIFSPVDQNLIPYKWILSQ